MFQPQAVADLTHFGGCPSRNVGKAFAFNGKKDEMHELKPHGDCLCTIADSGSPDMCDICRNAEGA